MAKFFNSNSKIPSSISTAMCRTAKPSYEFYSSFSEEEVLEITHSLGFSQEIPLKYSYKGRGAKIWDNFYLKYMIPRWYRTSNVEIDLLKENFEWINNHLKTYEKLNVVDVGSGNSYPVKAFIYRLNKLGKINQYIALDISEELLCLSQKNFQKWFPDIEFISHTLDIENNCLPKILLKNQANLEPDDRVKIILHLGVTIGNHQKRDRVFKNFRDSMGKNDLLVFTNEIGSNSTWDGKIRGGCNYHAKQIYEWTKTKIGIRAEDCELVRKYELETDSIVAKIKFLHDYRINFNFMNIDKTIKISKGEEITIWRHHKYELPELLQEIEQAGLKLVHYSTNKYRSHAIVICEVASH